MENKHTHGAWYALLDPRQQATVDHAISYAYNFSHAGVPGHSTHLLIAKLATELDKPAVVWRNAHWDDAGQCWRDIETGVKVPS